MNLIETAKQFAHTGHDSIQQVRKYSGEPYWVHTDEVAQIVTEYGGNDTMIAAAHAHDLAEDINNYPYNLAGISELFGFEVTQLVYELTDQYTSKNYPDKNRAWRKQHESDRIASISPDAKTIKLADLYSNSRSIVECDKDFARVYLKEKQNMMFGLREGNPRLYARVLAQLNAGLLKLNL